MSYTPRSGATISLNVDGASTSTRDIETVGEALRRLNDTSLTRVSGQLDDTESRIGMLKSTIGELVAVALTTVSITAFAGMVKGTIDATAGLHDMSIQTGISVAALMQFRSVAATTDTSLDAIANATNKLAKGMSVANEDSKGMAKTIKDLGLDFDTLKRASPEEKLLSVAKALNKFEDGSFKASAAMTLFSRGGDKLLPFLTDLADQSDKVTSKLTAQEIALRKAQAAMADDFGDNIAKVKEAAEEWKREIAGGMLPALTAASAEFLKAANAAGGLSDKIRELAADGTIGAWTESLVGGVKTIAAAIGPAIKIAAAYFAIFVAAPAVIATVGAVLTKVVGAVALYTMNVLIGQVATVGWNTALFGTAVAANTAAGGLFTMKTAGMALFAAFAGWQLGKFISENDVNVFGLFTIKANEVRAAGAAMVGMLLVGWEKVKYGAEMMGAGMSYAWTTTINVMKAAFGQYLSGVASGLSMIGAKTVGQQLEAYADSLKKGAREQQSFADSTKGITAAHAKAVDAIENDIIAQMQYELATKKVTDAEAAAAGPKRTLIGLTDDQRAALEKRAAAQKDFIDGLEKEVRQLGLSASAIKLQDAAALGMSKGQLAHVKVLLATRDAYGEVVKKAEELKKAREDHAEKLGKMVSDAKQEADANELLVRNYGMSKEAIELLTIAKLEAEATNLRGIDLLADEVAALDATIAARKRNAAALRTLSVLDKGTDVTRAKELLDVMIAVDEAAKSAASGMAASFGRVGAAIGGLTTALSGYGRAQATIAAELAAATKAADGDKTKVFQANTAAAAQSAQAQVKSYGDMASAAKGFFKENTTGYKIMEGTEKAFRAAEMFMAIQSMVTKSGLLTAFTGLFVASKTTQAAAEATSTAGSVVNAGVQSSAWGVTAVVKALASLPFPANLAAGAATLAAVIAIGAKIAGSFGGGGSGGGQSAAEAQKAQGTGSVFGDTNAKSDTIIRSLDLLGKNSDSLIPINRGMLAALNAIQQSMSGVANLIVRSPGAMDGSNMGIREGTISKSTGASIASGATVGAAAGAYFGPIGMAIGAVAGAIIGGLKSIWGKTKQSIVDAGLQFSGSLRDLQAGKGIDQYASVDTTKSSWFGLSKKTTNAVQTQGVSSELSAQFGMIFTNVEQALAAAANGLGIGSATVTKALDALVIDVTSVSLKGLTGDALTQAINSVVSKTMDEMAQAAIPGMDAFRQVGEGYAETVIRLASNYATLDATLGSVGLAFGATGVSSLAAREYLIGVSGGLDKLSGQTSAFADNFLTEAERLAPVQKYVTEEMARLGYAGVKTRDDFKAAVIGLVDSGALATAAGADIFSALMAVQEGFALVTPAIEATGAAAKTAAQTIDEARNLQDQYDSLTMSPQQLADKARAKVSPANLALYDDVQSATAASNLAATNQKYIDQLRDLDRASMSVTERLAAEAAGMDASTVVLRDLTIARQAEFDAAQATAAANKNYQAQIDDFLKSQMSVAEARLLEEKGMDESTRALYRRLNGLKDEKLVTDAATEAAKAHLSSVVSDMDKRFAVAEKVSDQVENIRAAADEGAVDLASKRASMETALFNLTHTASEQLVRQRELELAAMDSTLRPLQQQIYAMEDQASAAAIAATALESAAASARAVANERGGLQREMFQLTGNTVELRKLELAALDPTNRALKESIFALQDKQAAEAAAASVAQAMAAAQAQAAEDSKRAAEELKSAWAAATSSIMDEVARIRGLAAGSRTGGLAAAQATFATTTAQARAGDMDAAKLLPQLSQAMLTLAEASAVTAFDLRLIRAQAASSLELTGGALSKKFGLNVPSYDVGTDFVPQTGLALIHKGEKITPAAYNKPFTAQAGGNSELLAEIRALRAEVAALRASTTTENIEIIKGTRKTADKLEKFDKIGILERAPA